MTVQKEIDDPHDPTFVAETEDPPFIKDARILDLVRKGAVFTTPELTEHRERFLKFLSAVAIHWQDVGDVWVSLCTMYSLISQRYDARVAEEMFKFLGTPTYSIDEVAAARVALFKKSGLNKSEFSRKVAAERGTSEESEYRELNRALAKIAKKERRATAAARLRSYKPPVS
jgi:hypothetical protein